MKDTPTYIYVITNPYLVKVENKVPGKMGLVEPVKIGRARDVPKRLGSLNTSMTENFVDRLVVKLENERDAIVLENMVQEVLNALRIFTKDGSSTEFFACPYQFAIAEVKRIAKKLHFKLTEFKHMGYVGRSGSAIKKNHKTAAKPQSEEKKGIAAPFRFSMIGVKPGSKLVFVPTNVEVSVAEDRKISHGGSLYTLTGFCKAFMPDALRNKSNAYQGPAFFAYQGKLLTELRQNCRVNK